MSDSVRPHRLQPTRLPRPWDAPGKNTGVGCHFLLQCMKVKSESEVAPSCPTLHDSMDCSLPGSSVHGIFQARVLEWGAIAFSVFHPTPPQIYWLNYFSTGFQFLRCSLTSFPSLDSIVQHYYHPLTYTKTLLLCRSFNLIPFWSHNSSTLLNVDFLLSSLSSNWQDLSPPFSSQLTTLKK